MVRESRLRKETWNKKIEPELIGKIWKDIKDVAYEQVSKGLDNLVEWEQKAKKVIEKYGVPLFEHPQYINFARELGEISKKFTKPTLNKEASALAQKWYMRGLDARILKEIAKEFGIDIEILIKFFEPKVKAERLTQPRKDLQINLVGFPYGFEISSQTIEQEFKPTTSSELSITQQPRKDLQINLTYEYSIL